MSRIAVVGGGIAGLSAAYLLSRKHDVLLFERADRLGGHTHTHHIDTPDGRLALDTGFLVHNDRTYPRLIRLFDEIGVERLDSDMSFGVTDRRNGFEFSTRDVSGLFADRRNLARPGHYRFLLDLLRFNRAAREVLRRPDLQQLTLGEFLDERGLTGEIADRFVLPLAASIWSASTDRIREFPVLTLVQFMDQHGMITLFDHPNWKVVRGGSATYISKLINSPRIEVRLNAAPTAVRREGNGIRLEIDAGPNRLRQGDGDPPKLRAKAEGPAYDCLVDEVVFACHGDEVLPMLLDPTPVEREVIGAFETTPNDAWLHTDASFLPRRLAARASWNYLLGHETECATITYHLNRLQRLTARHDYCVTLNPPTPIDPSKVLARMSYTHPRYTRRAVAAQARWADVSGVNRIHYCGAYWYYGFHEDGLRSAVRVADALGVRW